jgi:hypothetical protein
MGRSAIRIAWAQLKAFYTYEVRKLVDGWAKCTEEQYNY